jgi:multiple sugar transport system substrate-binding protein
MRRRLGVLATAGLLTVSAACTTAGGGDEAVQSPSPSPSTSAPPEPVTLEFGVYGPDGVLEAYDELAEVYSEQHPEVTVEVEHAPTSGALLSNVASRSSDGPDVFLIDHDELPSLVGEGVVQPVDELLEQRDVDFGDGFQRDGLEAFSAAARLQCMPHDVSPMVVYYNPDLVDPGRQTTPGEEPPSAETGWSFEQFAQAARQASNGPVDGVHVEPGLQQLAPFVWSAGGELVDDPQTPTTLTLSEPDSRAALEQVLGLLRDPAATPTRRELRRQDAVDRFQDGKLAMILGTRALTPELREGEVPFDVLPLPSLGRFRTVADMTGFCISRKSEHVPAAADFLAFAVGSEGAAITAESGYVVPSNLDVVHSSDFLQPGEAPGNAFVFVDGVRRSERTPFVPQWPQVERAVQPELARLFYAPVIDLDRQLRDIDAQSKGILAPNLATDEG